MPWMNTNMLDSGLSYATTNGKRVDICTTEPTTYAQATSNPGTGYSLGYGATTTGSPAARSSGRKVTVAAISGASVTYTGSATYWALTDNSSILVATGSLSASQSVTSGNTFSLAAFDLGIPQVGGS